jgi:hypothetical protein
LSGPVVEADRTRKELLGIEPVAPVREGSWQGAYDPQFTLRVYDEVFRRASEALESGRPVVLDASFRSQVLRQRAREFASAHGVRFYFVECRADPETCKARLRERERQPSVSDGRVELFDDFVAQWEPVAELDPDQHLVVDTARPLGETMQTLRSFVESWPGGLVQ